MAPGYWRVQRPKFDIDPLVGLHSIEFRTADPSTASAVADSAQDDKVRWWHRL